MSFLDDTLRVDTNASVLSPGDAFTNSLFFNNTNTPGADSGNCHLCHAPLPFTHHLALTTHALKRQLLDGKLTDRRELATVKARLHQLTEALKQTNQDLASAKHGSGGKQEELKRRVLMLISQMKHRIYHEYIPAAGRGHKERQCEVLGEIVREELERDPRVAREVSQEPLQR